MQSRVFIFVGMVESIAIYGIVMMFIILGQWGILYLSQRDPFFQV
jgi:F0F1-type ATP synthase membrane subunit c/vacuolar-type H+-ATPase subunit K